MLLANSPWTAFHWGTFASIVGVMLLMDLLVFHRQQKAPSLKQAFLWTIFWCLLALCFNGYVWHASNRETALQFLTGYLVEWSLSMDNVFVFAVVFSFFGIPVKYQHRVLFWGILGAVVLRLAFILLGSNLIRHFEWIMWIFGGFLVYSGMKLALKNDDEVHPDKNIIMKLAKKILPIATEIQDQRFFVRKEKRWYVTPLFLVLLVIESTDVLFAVDSVPAIFGITRDPFIVFTSNIFAILGLRALYFMLAGIMHNFRYLHYGLSSILVFVGAKMMIEYWIPHPQGGHWITPAVSLTTIAFLLAVSIIASYVANVFDKKNHEKST